MNSKDPHLARIKPCVADTMEFSIIITVFNESESVKLLIQELSGVFNGHDYELVVVDDGSSDGTFEMLKDCLKPPHQSIRLARRNGKSFALAAGIRRAKSQYIATMDGDLQDDPSDILRLLENLEKENWDMVIGRRKKRNDPWLVKRFPSVIANGILQGITGTRLQDINCPVRVFKKDLLNKIRLFGQWHRLLPLYALYQGMRVNQIEVNHRPRLYGKSAVGFERTGPFLRDIMTLLFSKELSRPLRLRAIACTVLWGSFLGAAFLIFSGGKSYFEKWATAFSLRMMVEGILLLVMAGLLIKSAQKSFNYQDNPIE